MSVEELKVIFNDLGCTYLSGEYKNNKSKLTFLCSCTEKHTKTLPKFKKSPRCPKCALKIRSKKNRTGYIEIIKMFEEKGCLLTTTEDDYVDQRNVVEFICRCGRPAKIKPNDFRSSGRCRKCGFEARAAAHLYSIDYINRFVAENSNCELISTSYNISTDLLEFKCVCKKSFFTTFINFKHENKRQCNECGIASRSGEYSPFWKGGITPEIQRIRQSSEYASWRNIVFDRDNHTCQCCLDASGGNLQAHHIENFSTNESLRFEIMNGITMCSICHDFRNMGSFHNKYGTRNNTKEQLIEYISQRRIELGVVSAEMPFLLQS